MSENPFAGFTDYEDEPPEDDADEQALARWQPKGMVEVPTELVMGVAVGMEDADEVAARFGFTGEKWAALQAWEPFKQAVKAKLAELEQSGYTFRLKSAIRAEMLADQVFIDAMSNDATYSMKVDAMKTFAKFGDLEPKPQATVQQPGSGFSITINLPSPLTAPAPAPLVQRVAPDPETIEVDLGDLEP